jgi:hypothetical protein
VCLPGRGPVIGKGKGPNPLPALQIHPEKSPCSKSMLGGQRPTCALALMDKLAAHRKQKKILIVLKPISMMILYKLKK